MNEKRLKVDFLFAFWGSLIVLNILSMSVSWYIGDLANYWYCAVMLLFCIAGLYFSFPRGDKDK